jgi:protein-tyrosine phosphatase
MITFVDIHCHLLPEIDDGAKSLEDSLAMAEIAVSDGIETVVVTPHQLGSYSHNHGDQIRRRTAQLQAHLHAHAIPLTVLPGADVRIEDGMLAKLKRGEVLTLGDHGRHVLLELPHEMYFPLEPVLDALRRAGIHGILSHPERNQGLLKNPTLVESLVDYGCLMQVTSGSLMGTFGRASQEMGDWMLREELVHFLATDAHSPQARRPLIRRAFEHAARLVGEETAEAICRHNPSAVADGRDVEIAPRKPKRRILSGWFNFNRRKAG